MTATAHRTGANASGASSRAQRIPGLDGIRALAIITVLVFHLSATWLPGGYLGVDVFFVISGFLITTLLLGELAGGDIDLRAFWVRRARRLLPGLVVCVAVSLLVARAVSDDLVVQAGRQVVGALTFSTNWIEIAANQSYFEHTAPELFMNFWSLAVEEQFYLFWPLIMYFVIRRLAPARRVIFAVALAALSTLLMARFFVPGEDATRVYYGTDTHLMGLMVGAALAFAWAGPARLTMIRWWARYGRYAMGVALVVLAVSFARMSNETPFTFRGGITVVCVATATLVFGVINREVPSADGMASRAVPRNAFQRLIDAPWATWVGRRSYGIYLWHWPLILIIGRDYPVSDGSAGFYWSRLAIVIATFLVADASFRFVEEPVRKLGFRASAQRLGEHLLTLPRRARLSIAGGSALLVAALVLVLVTAPAESSTARMLAANAATSDDLTASTPAAAVARPDTRATTATKSASATKSSTSTPRTPSTATASVKPTATAAPPPAAAKANFTMPDGDEIDAFGDSLMVGSVHALRYYFPGIRVDAKSNRRWLAALAEIKAQHGSTRRAVILGLGTNGGNDADDLNAVLDALGPNRMVVILNLYGPFSRIDTDNATLAQVVAGRPNVIVADWNAAANADHSVLQPDGIHPSLPGSHVYAKVVRQAFATLSERHTGKKVALKALPMP